MKGHRQAALSSTTTTRCSRHSPNEAAPRNQSRIYEVVPEQREVGGEVLGPMTDAGHVICSD